MSDVDAVRADDFAPAEVLASTSPIGFFGVVRVKAGADVGETEKAMNAMAAAARQEQGCEQYAVYTTVQEPGAYGIHERWSTGADLRRHIENPVLRPYISQFAQALDFEPNWLIELA